MKTDKQWEKIGFKHHHGIVVPLFSLRSKKSCGIGEFNDLIPIIDWCASLGLDIIQLLPMNDSAEDASPYNPISSCALDPIYLSLVDLPQSELLDLSSFKPLSELPRLDRGEVKRKKLDWLYEYYLLTFEAVAGQNRFQQFMQNNPWLEAYTQLQSHERREFYNYLQFLCFEQLRQVKIYATEKQVFLKGDLPILMSAHSVDVRSEPELFDVSLDAGAAPDYFSQLGQHWGFPLMNWEAMREKGFAWWKRRLSIAEQFFHIYRIDHIVGLFRIWGIPKGEKPYNGHFVPANPLLWIPQGREILEMMIDATTMLPVGEDLGVVLDEMIAVFKELGICGTRVIRWKRRWNTDLTYVPYEEYEPLSLTTVSTHDSEPLALWWKNNPAEATIYAQFKNWTYSPNLTIAQRTEILSDSHHTPSCFHVNPLQEYLTLFPEFSWPNLEDERINVPGTVSSSNWTYRFRPFVEEMIVHKPLAQLFEQILKKPLL